MYYLKRVPVRCVTKFRDNQIFKALLRIKKSFKSVDFDLSKYVLVSRPTHPWTGWVNFDWSGNYKIIIYLCIHSYYLFVLAWLHIDTAPYNSFKYWQFPRITNIKNVFLIVFSSQTPPYSIRKNAKKSS